jgi:monoterpene epsilon-lactone hydrolase
MSSLRSRLIYWLLKVQKSTFDPRDRLLEQRALLENQAKRAPMPPNVVVQPIAIGDLPAEWLRPVGVNDDRAVLYLHGGGYTLGSCNTHRALGARLALASQTPVLVIDYRLAPEHPFPAALKDAAKAYRWLIDPGMSVRPIALAGDSAGGGLAIATAIALRDQGDQLPAAIVCMSPWADLTIQGESMVTRACADPLISRESSLYHAALYVDQQDPNSPLISPVYADLRGLPPLLIQAGDREVLLSDSVCLAEHARQAGVDTTLEVWDGMWHVWQAYASYVPEAQQAIDRVGAFINQHLTSRVDKQL